MKKEFWLDKWENNQTGFHKDIPHPLLIENINKLSLEKEQAIFIPLCGKSLDMLWLNAQGYTVIGVELSQIAVEQFFSENNLTFTLTQDELFNIYTYENITIYQGDYFDLNSQYLNQVKAVYDRASLIALPEQLIKKYTEHMYSLLPLNAQLLLITLELQRTTTDALGPPFSVPDAKVKKLYQKFTTIKLLRTEDIINREGGFQKQGCEYVYERIYLITK
jgi:thiopurine S-methyltransferase